MDELERFKRIISSDTVSTLLETYGLLFHYSYIGYNRPGDLKKMELIEIEILSRIGGKK
jgi:hypothetical protein